MSLVVCVRKTEKLTNPSPTFQGGLQVDATLFAAFAVNFFGIFIDVSAKTLSETSDRDGWHRLDDLRFEIDQVLVVTQYATAKIGAIAVNINPAYRAHELEFVLNQSGSTVLVAAERLKTSDYAGMIAEVRPRCPELKTVVLLGSPQWQALLETGRRLDRGTLDTIELDTDDPINIQYTSGTTGFPKGATLSHHNILNNGFFVGELCNYTEADRICIPVPFYHCFGMVMGNLAATSHGACMVIPAPTFDPVATLQAVQAERCTSLYGVPTIR